MSVTSNRNEWVGVDLESVYSVNAVQLHPHLNGEIPAYGFPIDFKILTSVDGMSWTTALAVTNQPLPVAAQMITFSAVDARYVRIAVSQLRANPEENGNYSFQLAELDVLGYVSPPVLMWDTPNGSLVLEWEAGVLQSAGSLHDIFNDIPAAESPYTNDFSSGAFLQFYKLRY